MSNVFSVPSGLSPVLLLGSFLLGSIPFAVISMMGSGVDIRSIGSGNPGFNNVLRYSKSRAVVCLLGDLGKGVAAILLFTHASDPVAWRWMHGLAVMLGHCYTPWLRFRGGKGVATSLGVMLVLYPWLALPCVGTYIAGRAVGKKLKWREEGARSSLASSGLFVVLVFLQDGSPAGLWALVFFAVVVWRHKENLRRMVESPGE